MDKSGKKNRRDFLFTASYTLGAIGLGATVWPFIDQMNHKLPWYVANQRLIQTFGSGTHSQKSLNIYTNIT